MEALYTAAQVKALETGAGLRGVPTRELMERAGAAIARAAAAEASPDGRFFVLCGPGNNGGDGLVVARVLAQEGRAVHAVLLGSAERLPAEAAAALGALGASGVPLVPISALEGLAPTAGDVVVDAIFGTGLSRPPGGALGAAIEQLREWRAQGARVVSADVPSGVASDTGAVLEPCVRADVTVALGVFKPAHALEPARGACGEVQRVDIGIVEPSQGPWLARLTPADVLGWIPPREAGGHKGTYGHLLVVAGSFGKTGAAALSARGALRGGVGLVSVAARGGLIPAILAHAPEVMGVGLGEGGALGPSDAEAILAAAAGCSAVVLGPGIPRDEHTHALLAQLIEGLDVPLLLDADGLNALSVDLSILSRARAPVVLTPHPGEMARLLGTDVKHVQADRLAAAQGLATSRGVTVVLKGAGTLIAHRDGSVRVNPTGNPGLATAGTGDVLSGVIGALLAGGLGPLEAACAGVYAHGLAADLAVARTGQRGLNASDLFEGLAQVWSRWER